MTYTYNNHLYEKESNAVLIIAGLIAVLNININKLNTGIAFIVSGVLIAFALKFIGKYRGDLKFKIDTTALKVCIMKKTANFKWSDIDEITEDDRGLIIKLKRNKIEFPILKDMNKFEEFKIQLIRKAFEFSFSINVL